MDYWKGGRWHVRLGMKRGVLIARVFEDDVVQ